MTKDKKKKKQQKETKTRQQKKAESALWKPYRKKIGRIFFKISLYLFIFIIFIAFSIGLTTYRKTLSEFDNKNVKELKRYIAVVNKQTAETRKNLTLAKKYNERWHNATEKHKYNQGISLQLIENEIANLSEKYNISDYDFTMSVPQKTHSDKNKILNFFTSSCKLTFNATDDVRAISFVDELKNNLVGYVIIENFSISKEKDYTFQDLVEISSGAKSGVLKVNISFKWFVAKK